VPSIVAWRTKNRQTRPPGSAGNRPPLPKFSGYVEVEAHPSTIWVRPLFTELGPKNFPKKADFVMKQTNICRLSGDIINESWHYSKMYRWQLDKNRYFKKTKVESYLLESFELDVTEVRFAWVETVRPEILVTQFGSLGCSRVGRPTSLERRRTWRSMRLGTLRYFCLINLKVAHWANNNDSPS